MQRLIEMLQRSILLPRNKRRVLILQHLHNAMHHLFALRMASHIDTALLLRLALRMRLLRTGPRVRVRPGRLHIIRLLRRGRVVDARDIHRLVF